MIIRILLLFLLSGSTSLAYEVVWMRRLSLVFGHSIFSISTVLTTFMSGLALGSYLGGRWSDRQRQKGHSPASLLKVYGNLELFIGLWALLSLVLLNAVESGFLSLSRSGAESSLLTVLLFVCSFLVLLPPTTAMGATLPIFTQVLVLHQKDTGTLLSRIYGINTLGACLGAGIAGMVGLPSLGLNKTVVVTAILNIAVMILAYSLAGHLNEAPTETPLTEHDETPAALEVGSPPRRNLVPLVFGLSGFAGMVYQLGWTRALVLSIGSSTYSFSIILTSFLASLGLGSFLYRRIFKARQPVPRDLALLQTFIALSALLVTVGIGYLPRLKLFSFSRLEPSFTTILTFDAFVIFLLLLLPTLALGLTFPLVTHLYTSRLEELGRRLGEAYAANTLGAILGSFFGGFVLLPLLGLQNSIKLAAFLNLFGGVALLLSQTSGRKFRKGIELPLILGTVAAMLFAPPWDLALMTSGVGISYQGQSRRPNVIFYRDGVSATVSVGLNSGLHPYIVVNGKTDASLSPGDRSTQLLLGLVPAALHPNPKDVAVIGFGSGQTPVALLSVPGIEEVRCAELEPAVLEAQKFFSPFSEGALEDPRLKRVEDDGRSFILGSPKKFDIIVSEPSNPWIAGIGNLYTQDFYEGARRQLQPGGVMAQWIHLYALSETDIQLVYRTFFAVFPHGSIYRTSPGDLLLIGSEQPIEFDPARLETVFSAESRASFWFASLSLVEPQMLFATYLADRDDVLSYLDSQGVGLGSGPINTDDLPLLEFRAPLGLFAPPTGSRAMESFKHLVPSSQKDVAHIRQAAFLGRWTLDFSLDATAEFQSLTKLDPQGKDWYPALLQGLVNSSDIDFLRIQSSARPKDQSWIQRFGIVWAQRSQKDLQLLQLLTLAQQSAPSNSRLWLLLGLGRQLARENQPEKARQAFAEAAKLTTGEEPLRESVVLVPTGGPEDLQLLYEAIKRNPHVAESHSELASRLYKEGKIDEALQEALEAYRLYPIDSNLATILSEIYRAKGDPELTFRYAAEAKYFRSLETLDRVQRRQL